MNYLAYVAVFVAVYILIRPAIRKLLGVGGGDRHGKAD